MEVAAQRQNAPMRWGLSSERERAGAALMTEEEIDHLIDILCEAFEEGEPERAPATTRALARHQAFGAGPTPSD